LGAARGQRLRKEPCASFPTRHSFSSVSNPRVVTQQGLKQGPFCSTEPLGIALALHKGRVQTSAAAPNQISELQLNAGSNMKDSCDR
jgi:hypothetical protein